jgi:hypothetical protein
MKAQSSSNNPRILESFTIRCHAVDLLGSEQY